MKSLLTLTPVGICLSLLVFSRPVEAQDTVNWDEVWGAPTVVATDAPKLRPGPGFPVSPRLNSLKAVVPLLMFERAPKLPADSAPVWTGGLPIKLPDPTGKLREFRVYRDRIGVDGKVATFVGLNANGGRCRLTASRARLYAQVRQRDGADYHVVPLESGDYATYNDVDPGEIPQLDCAARPQPTIGVPADKPRRVVRRRLKCRIALACTSHFTKAVGGREKALEQIVTAVHRLAGLLESELGLILETVASPETLVFDNADTDPFAKAGAELSLGAMLEIAQSVIDERVGRDKYDIGHVLCARGGGLATLGAVLHQDKKAQGVTGKGDLWGDAFIVTYVLHEIAHQLGANHTFSGSAGACNGNAHPATAVEPGSGSTVTGYAGICRAEDLQGTSDPYFHGVSVEEMVDTIDKSGLEAVCEADSKQNRAPELCLTPTRYVIPRSTPFALTVEAKDADGDDLTYCWEQVDGALRNGPIDVDTGVGPIFRSWSPSTQPTRCFPELKALIAGRLPKGECYPRNARQLRFRVVVRDNAFAPGIAWDELKLQIGQDGPFLITFPHEGASISRVVEIQWNLAKTHRPPYNVTKVNIDLSDDGGESFRFRLATETPNDGCETVTVPSINRENAIVRVSACENVFFAISRPFELVAAKNAMLIIPQGKGADVGAIAFDRIAVVGDGPVEGPFASLAASANRYRTMDEFLSAEADNTVDGTVVCVTTTRGSQAEVRAILGGTKLAERDKLPAVYVTGDRRIQVRPIGLAGDDVRQTTVVEDTEKGLVRTMLEVLRGRLR